MHHIQRGVISSLVQSSPLRFSELQPKHIPNNTFSYHLKKLLDSGYIESTIDGYIPTRRALKAFPYASAKEHRAPRPATISMLYITDDTGRILLIKRRQKPFTDWHGIPSGLIHSHETLDQAAKRELYEKTGIDAPVSDLQPHGVLDFRYLEHGTEDILVHAIAFVYSYKYTGPLEEVVHHTLRHGTLEWQTLDGYKILPEVHEAAKIVQDGLSMRSVNFAEPTT